MNIEKNWLYAAISEANKANFTRNKAEFRLGALIIKDGKIISRGCNHKVSDRTFFPYGYYCSIHAECLAIHRARRRGDVLMVVRVLKNGNLTMAAPCKRCYAVAKKFGIKRIIYSDWNGNLQEIKV